MVSRHDINTLHETELPQPRGRPTPPTGFFDLTRLIGKDSFSFSSCLINFAALAEVNVFVCMFILPHCNTLLFLYDESSYFGICFPFHMVHDIFGIVIPFLDLFSGAVVKEESWVTRNR